MKTINRMMVNICSSNLASSRAFYVKLFDFVVKYDSDWFIHLVSKDQKLELGIIDKSSDLVPVEFRDNPQGFYNTFVVDDADELYKIAQSEGFEIVREPTNTFYGQRRLLLKDPNGALIDISSPMKDFTF